LPDLKVADDGVILLTAMTHRFAELAGGTSRPRCRGIVGAEVAYGDDVIQRARDARFLSNAGRARESQRAAMSIASYFATTSAASPADRRA